MKNFTVCKQKSGRIHKKDDPSLLSLQKSKSSVYITHSEKQTRTVSIPDTWAHACTHGIGWYGKITQHLKQKKQAIK